MNKLMLKRALRAATGCALQHTGWPCGTCFFSLSKRLTNKDWQALLLYRGDYKKEALDNLPCDIKKSLQKIFSICEVEE